MKLLQRLMLAVMVLAAIAAVGCDPETEFAVECKARCGAITGDVGCREQNCQDCVRNECGVTTGSSGV